MEERLNRLRETSEDEGSGREAEAENAELEQSLSPPEAEIFPRSAVNRHVEIRILQID